MSEPDLTHFTRRFIHLNVWTPDDAGKTHLGGIALDRATGMVLVSRLVGWGYEVYVKSLPTIDGLQKSLDQFLMEIGAPNGSGRPRYHKGVSQWPST